MAGLTIGSVAEACGLSKSGMFAHFGSKEALQLAVVENAQQHFVREVFQPILTLERGLPRLQALMAAWLEPAGRRPQPSRRLPADGSSV